MSIGESGLESRDLLLLLASEPGPPLGPDPRKCLGFERFSGESSCSLCVLAGGGVVDLDLSALGA